MIKFVIIPKKDEDNLYKLLPLITGLYKSYEDPEINIVHTQNLETQLSVIPFKANFHFVDERDFGPVSSVKLAAKVSDLFNITNTLVYRSEVGVLQFAKSIKAKNRLGWKSLINDVFLTESIEKGNSESYLSLVAKSKTLNIDFNELGELLNLKDKKVPENFFKESGTNPFLFVSCDNFSSDNVIRQLISNLSQSLNDKRIIVWSRQDSALLKDLASEQDCVIDASAADESMLHHYVTRCHGFVSSIDWHCHMSCFLGVTPYYLSNSAPAIIESFKYHPEWIAIVNENSFTFKNRRESEGEVSELNIDELTNTILEELNL